MPEHPLRLLEDGIIAVSAIRQTSLYSPLTPTLIRIDTLQKWHQITQGFRDNNYRQGWGYGQGSAQRYNARIERMAVRNGNEIIGAAMVRLKSIPFLNTGIAYIGGGPLTRRGRDDDLASQRACLAAFQREYIQLRRHTLRILPPLHPAGAGDDVTANFRASGFAPSAWPPPFRTILVDIRRPIDAIRKTLAQKWRNGLNNSEKRGMVIRRGDSLELFRTFEGLFDRFLDRKRISVDVGADFYTEIRSRGAENECYYVNIAYADNLPVAGQLVSLLGDTGVTLLAATSETGLKYKASNLLQWDSVVEAHRRGMHWFDLGGIEPESQPGVYHFKQGLGGFEVSNPGPFQLEPPGVMRSVTATVERLYRWSRHHRPDR